MKRLNLLTFSRKKLLLTFLFSLFAFSHLYADQGYVAINRTAGTMTFKYGKIPDWRDDDYDENCDYYETDNTHDDNMASWVDPYYSNKIEKVIFDPSFANARPKSCFGWFHNFQYLTSIEGIEYLNTSEVTTMEGMFENCYSLTSLDLSHFDTSQVTDMAFMFEGLQFTSIDVSHFNTENVTSMAGMFWNCNYIESFDLRNFNTAKVKCTDGMFYQCGAQRIIWGKDFSTVSLVDAEDMYSTRNLRYVDYYASDDTDAIHSGNKADLIPGYGSYESIVTYLPHGSQELTDVRNVVYSYNGDENDLRCPWYYSNNFNNAEYDAILKRFLNDIEFPRTFKTNKAQYVRRPVNNTYGSIILPYEFKSNNQIQAYTLGDEHTETMYFKDAATIPSHTPFAFKKLNEDEVYASFVVEDETGNFGVTVEATRDTSGEEGPYVKSAGMNGWTVKGYYVAERVNDYSDAFYIAGDKFYKADGPLTMYPHRVTFHGTWAMEPSAEEGSKFFEIATMPASEKPDEQTTVGEETAEDLPSEVVTAIEAADLRRELVEAKAIYDAQGYRLSALQKGLNIIRKQDGSVKKVMMK